MTSVNISPAPRMETVTLNEAIWNTRRIGSDLITAFFMSNVNWMRIYPLSAVMLAMKQSVDLGEIV